MITVLLSVFNGGKWLDKSISSILIQTYHNFEFLIINDGSMDNSLEIIKKYSLIDKRIKIFSHKNIGLTKSLNEGIKNSKGKWIARIDADDIACPERLELQLNYANKHNLSLVGCQSNIIDANDKFKQKIYIPTDSKKLYENLKKQKSFFSHSSVLFDKNLVLKLGGYRETMNKAQDYDLWLRIAEVSKIGAIKYTGVLIREHNKRISNKDKGIEQRIYAHCANVSRILRKDFPIINDPLDINCKLETRKYKNFIKEYLLKTGTIIFYERLFLFKEKTNNASPKNYLLIPLFFNNFSLFIKLLLWIVKGDFISKKLAYSWVRIKRDI